MLELCNQEGKVCKDDAFLRFNQDRGTSTGGRSIGGGRDKSAPTEVPILVVIDLIGGGCDQSAPTEGRRRLLISIMVTFFSFSIVMWSHMLSPFKHL